MKTCGDAPCQNGATCVDDVASFSCHCAPGYNGSRCESTIDGCASDPCENGGTCQDGERGFVCTCAVGYTGDRCEIDIDDCSSDPCFNNATCVDGLHSYACRCAPGFKGKRPFDFFFVMPFFLSGGDDVILTLTYINQY